MTDTESDGNGSEPLVKVDNLVKYYPIYGGLFRHKLGDVKAVDDVSFEIREGEVLGLVGESGCGKSTLGRTLIRLQPATSGEASLAGESIFAKRGSDLKRMRRRMQIIFQDPVSSLNPRMPVNDIIGEGLLAQADRENGWRNRKARDERIGLYLERVGLRRDYARRYPHEFSGGQRQRIGIARALALEPDFVVCDEPVSALDVSIQSQILNLLKRLRKEMGLTMIFISHDISVVRYIADRIAVMYLGRIVELGEAETIVDDPFHIYTRALMSAIPQPDPRVERSRQRILLRGDPPSPLNPPTGCHFWPRSPVPHDEEMKRVEPQLVEISPGHFAANCPFCLQRAS
ncbi:ABC transporter ATP-binding protein [Sphingomonas sp.]|uniref:ABC transporter ATP-binding protein n=1 Tax=Sphingomonas sp. TaxID=28214 RepID=UPI00183E50B6|nr:ABC transporter ATP-binding protein [Sphingomonas sp.]MBA3512403.1 ABC transporter ATP-binding protein [Sphingomonas sp.]